MLAILKKSLKELISIKKDVMIDYVGINVGINVGVNVGVKFDDKIKDKDFNMIILSLLRNEPGISVKNLANMIGISQRHAERKIAHLKRSGKIERIGASKNGYWKVRV